MTIDAEANTEEQGREAPKGVYISGTMIAATVGVLTILSMLVAVVWSLAAQAEQVKDNTNSIEKLSCLPVQMARVETKIDNNTGLLNTILEGVQREKDD